MSDFDKLHVVMTDWGHVRVSSEGAAFCQLMDGGYQYAQHINGLVCAAVARGRHRDEVRLLSPREFRFRQQMGTLPTQAWVPPQVIETEMPQ